MQKGGREKTSASTAYKTRNILLGFHLKVHHFKRNVCYSNYNLCYKPMTFRILTQEIKNSFRDTRLFHLLVSIKPLYPCVFIPLAHSHLRVIRYYYQSIHPFHPQPSFTQKGLKTNKQTLSIEKNKNNFPLQPKWDRRGETSYSILIQIQNTVFYHDEKV